MDNILKQGDVDTTSSQIGDEENACDLLAESKETVLTSPLVHRTVNVVCLESSLAAELVKVLDVVLGGTEHDRALVLPHMLSQSVKERRVFLTRPYAVEVKLKLVRELRVPVDLHHSVIFHA